jgi:outer membrane protein assembly factor BamB
MMRHSPFPARVLGLLLMITATGSLRADWPTFHGDYSLTGHSETELRGKPTRIWRTDSLGGAIAWAPVGEGEQLYALTEGGKVVALSLAGETTWSRTIMAPASLSTGEAATAPRPAVIAAPLTLAGDLLLVATEAGIIHALGTTDGRTRWSHDSGSHIQGSVGVEQDSNSPTGRLIVLTQSEGIVHALDPATGKPLWQTKATARSDGHAAVAHGRAVFGSCAAAFHLVDTSSGALDGKVSLAEGCEMAGGIALDQGHAYAGNRSGQFVCIDLARGAIAWTFDKSEGQLFTTPAIGHGEVVIAGDDGVIYQLDKANGRLRWRYDSASDLLGDPVIAGDKVVISEGGSLTLLSLADGARLWSTAISDEITSAAIIGGMIIVGADDGTLSAFK